MKNLSDEQLVSAYLKGDEQALENLIARYLSPLYNFAFKYVHSQAAAEDVVQDSILKIWRNLKKFNGKYKFKTWAYTITKNTALDFLKKKGLVPLTEAEDLEQNSFVSALASPAPLPEELMHKVDDAEMVNLAVGKLPSKYRQVLDLYYQHDLNFRQISELLKESIDTIKTRHRRAVIYLKKNLLDK